MRKPEILSPAGNPEKLKAAVRFGADAVYLAGKSFGMRAGAGNFTLEEMEEAIKYAHSHGVKVYVTVNTLFTDRQLPEGLALAADLYQWGADALIVADLGLARILHEQLPDFPLHASTQSAPGKWTGKT